MTALILFTFAVALVLTGGLLAWPVARRVGERNPDRLYWVPVDTDVIRQWVPVQPPPPRIPWRTRVSDWWATSAPRDPHAVVRLAMAGPSRGRHAA